VPPLFSEAVNLKWRRPHGLMLALAAATVVLAGGLIGGALLVATGGDDDGGSESKSLKRDFRAPQRHDVDEVYAENDFSCGDRDTVCVRDYLIGVTSQYGPRASLSILERLQREGRVDLSVNDHDLAHAVGRETAKDFGSNFQSFDLCPTIFNYGCPHGFFEYVLARTDTPKEAAASICETVGGQKSRLLIAGFSCYHGVGHGVMMAQAYDLQESLSTCNTLGSTQAKDGCWQGVFMENVNAVMTNRARKGIFSRKRPLAPCDTIGAQYKHECFINHSGWLMRVASNDVGKGSRFCLKVRGPHRSACMQSIGLMVTNPVWQAALAPEAGNQPRDKVAWELCARFPAAGRTDCVRAGVDNLANFDQLKVARQRDFCGEVAAAFKTGCYRQIGWNLRTRTQDQALIKTRCAELGPNRQACLAGAQTVA
jgi:hypothetical protein